MLFSMYEVASCLAILFLAALCYVFARREATVQKALYELDREVDRDAIERFAASGGLDHIKRVTVLITALNEKENLKQLLPRMPKTVLNEPYGVMLVDDGSTDGTADLARSFNLGVAFTRTQRGQGAALRLGYQLALAGEAEVLVIMDADGQNRPEEIETFLRPIIAGEADMVIGSRILGEFEWDDPVRRMGVHFFSFLTSLLTGTKITDCSNGFRAIRKEVLATIVGRLRQRQYSMSELNIETAKSGFRIREVPMTFLKRISGSSKKGNNILYALAFSRVIFGTWLRTLRY